MTQTKGYQIYDDSRVNFASLIKNYILYVCSRFPDLRKFRSYKGGSVRDLLRAMRNKASISAVSRILLKHGVVKATQCSSS